MKSALVTLACAAALNAGASAQTLRPGLWELSQTVRSASGEMERAMAEMQQQMAALPPEQRKMMQDMMARQGVGMGSGAGGAMTVKLCFTREMVERDQIPAQEGDCRTMVSPRSGNRMKMSFTCSNPPSSGEGEWTFVSPEAYTTRMVVRHNAQGRAETMNLESRGRWVSADCGAIRPLATNPAR